MHMLFKLIMLYLNPLIYLDKHIYELKMINFRLFYKLLAKKSSKLIDIDIKRCFWSRWILFRYFQNGLISVTPHRCTFEHMCRANLSTVLQLLKRQRSVLYFCIQWWMDLLISLKKSFFCLYSELVNLKFY